MRKEEWRWVKGYEGLYQVSNYGVVKSVERYKKGRNGYSTKVKERILKNDVNPFGYCVVTLYKDGKHRRWFVHRLVWFAFNGDIPEGMQINHINEVKTDNRIENLSLMSAKENSNWGTRNERVSKNKTNGSTSKVVLQFDLDGKLIREWVSLNEIRRELGYSNGNISNCCLGRYGYKTRYGYIWKFK